MVQTADQRKLKVLLKLGTFLYFTNPRQPLTNLHNLMKLSYAKMSFSVLFSDAQDVVSLVLKHGPLADMAQVADLALR